jgi:UDP-N-acetylglucosamine 2-epimerase (non-hydrolysing)
MKLAAIVGTRPDIIKMQPIIKCIEERNHILCFIHTGQHYDFNMSDVFLRNLQLPKPDYFLNTGSKSQCVQIGRVISRCETVLRKANPDGVLLLGDTNSALGAAISACKLSIPIGFVEAGCRSFDKSMPEEINRTLISHMATLNFAPTRNCYQNLLREGLPNDGIVVTGHPIVDLIEQLKPILSKNIYQDYEKDFILVTLHRRENILDKERIQKLLVSFDKISERMPVIFPCHPHTKKQIELFDLSSLLNHILVLDPVDYLQSLSLIRKASMVLTDSGGVQQESALLNTPCITLRDRTEWIETVNIGVNFIAGYNPNLILKNVRFVRNHHKDIMKRFRKNIFGRIGSSDKILNAIERSFVNRHQILKRQHV